MPECHAQRTPEWYAQRRGRITASNVGALLGMNPNRTKTEAIRAMILDWQELPSEFEGNIATNYGNANEGNARFAFECDHPQLTVVDAPFIPFEDWLGASPDALVEDDEILEIKCPFGLRNEENPTFKTVGEQPHYHAQMQIQMFCAKRPKCNFLQWNPRTYHVTQVYLDMEWINEYLPILHQIWKEYVAIRDQPMDMPECPESLAYGVALANKEAADAEFEKAKANLVGLARGDKDKIGIYTLSKVEKKGSVAYAKLVKDLLPDANVEPYRGKASEYWIVK